MLLQQGRRINTVLSVIECSLTRRTTSTWRRTISPVANSGGKYSISTTTDSHTFLPRETFRLCREIGQPRVIWSRGWNEDSNRRDERSRFKTKRVDYTRYVASSSEVAKTQTWATRRSPWDDPGSRRDGSSSIKCFYPATNNRSYVKVPATLRKRRISLEEADNLFVDVTKQVGKAIVIALSD